MNEWQALRDVCPYSEFYWSVFSRIWTEYEEILRISPYSVRMRENMEQKNSEYGHFLRSELFCYFVVNFPIFHRIDFFTEHLQVTATVMKISNEE